MIGHNDRIGPEISRHPRILRAVAVHSVGGTAILLARLGLSVEINRYVAPLPGQGFEMLFWTRLTQHIVFYVLLLGVAHATLYYRRYRERELAAAGPLLK